MQDALKNLKLREFGCPGCGRSLLLRLGSGELLVRCARCKGTPVHLSLIAAIRAHAGSLRTRDAYELSTRGAVHDFLRTACRSLATSEYLQDVEGGTTRAGIRCEDIQRLSFRDCTFDLCTSSEVFEHVPDDLAGFRELHRVLRPDGLAIFTVPLTGNATTVERAILKDGQLCHLLPPEYHGDRISGPQSVLVYRDYGSDIVDRVRQAGFAWAQLWRPNKDYFGHQRHVVVAARS